MPICMNEISSKPFHVVEKEMHVVDVLIYISATTIPALIDELIFGSLESILSEFVYLTLIDTRETWFLKHIFSYSEHSKALLYQKAFSEDDSYFARRRLFKTHFPTGNQGNQYFHVPVDAHSPFSSRNEAYYAKMRGHSRYVMNTNTLMVLSHRNRMNMFQARHLPS